MIKISKIGARRVEVIWETGDDNQFLRLLADIIHHRNHDKEKIKELKNK